MLFDYANEGKFDGISIIDLLSFNTKNDKAFSIGGRGTHALGKRNETLGRASLTTVFAKKVCAVRPMWFVMENVELIYKSKTLPEAINIFRENGYGLTQVVLDASLCGVPQKKKRYFLIGGLGEKEDFIKEELYRHLSNKAMTVYDYFGDELGTEYYYRHQVI